MSSQKKIGKNYRNGKDRTARTELKRKEQKDQDCSGQGRKNRTTGDDTERK